MSRKKRQQGEPEGAPAWMVTYSDLMTLLLVFFVLLYSFSIIDVEKFQAFLASFTGVGILESGPALLEEVSPASQSEKIGTTADLEELLRSRQAELLETYNLVKEFLEENGLDSQVEVRYEVRGVALDIKERILFDSGKADLKEEAMQLLDPLAQLFRKLNYMISVEGHTDNVPIHTVQFPTNWELSTARASRVVRYFIEQHHLDPRKFVAVGYGEFAPIVPNDSPANRALNRRVVILINSINVFDRSGEEEAK